MVQKRSGSDQAQVGAVQTEKGHPHCASYHCTPRASQQSKGVKWRFQK